MLTKRILVVDDDPLVCQSIEMMLAVDGHKVETATNAKQALALFEIGKFDAILTDYEMPLMRGDKLACAIKTISPGQRIGLITGYAGAISSAGGAPPAVDLVLLKPFGMDALRGAIGSLATKPG